MKLNKLLFSLGPTADEPCNKFCKIPYLGNLSVKYKQKYGIRLAYYSKSTIGWLLVNNKLDKNQFNGFYEL